MDNPFQINYPDQVDSELVNMAVGGDKNALQSLIMRHQVFIYNLALKMTRSVEDAEDLTQEVFIKAITGLGKFQGKSKFRTWLYRITINHFLKTRKRRAEFAITDFENYFDSIDRIPDNELNDQEQKELAESIEEIRISCTAGMLLCLDRDQRMIYILGEMFGIDHQIGSEILEISSGNFRIRLMRARKDLYNWMNARCGLVNKSNPCRCSKKTKAFIEAGFVDPDNLIFNSRYRHQMVELSRDKATSISNTIEDLHKNIFLSHPLQEPLTATKIVEEIFSNDLIKRILDV